jgi:tRNA dimethylallyltransferase
MNNLSIPIRHIPQKTVLVIAGPTASGKSSLALRYATQYDGEIISVDSRQIFRGMDIGTGKVTPEEQSIVSHHLIDICDPLESYNVTDFVRDANHLIDNIFSRGKLPILCGGTHFWIQALVDNQPFPQVPPNETLRQALASHSTEVLFQKLKLLAPERAKSIDRHNPVRLIRSIEITEYTKNHPPQDPQPAPFPHRNFLILALNPTKETLDAKIKIRLDERLRQGMIEEVQKLHQMGVSYERLEQFGLEYRFIALFLQGKLSKEVMQEELFFAIVHYAKRQRTWLRRWEKQGATIHWIV